METTGEPKGAAAGKSLRSGRTIQVQGPMQMTRGYGDQEQQVYDGRDNEEIFIPCKDNIDGLNDGSVRQKQRPQSHQPETQNTYPEDTDQIITRGDIIDEEDYQSTLYQSRLQLMEKIAELKARLKNNNQPPPLEDNEIQMHQHPRVIEAEIEQPGPSQNINRLTFQNSSQIPLT